MQNIGIYNDNRDIERLGETDIQTDTHTRRDIIDIYIDIQTHTHTQQHTHTHTHTHTHIYSLYIHTHTYIYIYKTQIIFEMKPCLSVRYNTYMTPTCDKLDTQNHHCSKRITPPNSPVKM